MGREQTGGRKVRRWQWSERALYETAADGEMGKRRALFCVKVRAGSGSERDDKRKGSPLCH